MQGIFGSAKLVISAIALVCGYSLLALYLWRMDLLGFQQQFLDKPTLLLPIGFVGLLAMLALGLILAFPAFPHCCFSRKNGNKSLSYLLAPKIHFFGSLVWITCLFLAYYLFNFSSIAVIAFAFIGLATFTFAQLYFAFSRGVTMQISCDEHHAYGLKKKRKAKIWLYIRSFCSNLLIGVYSFAFSVALTKSSALGNVVLPPEPIRLAILLVVVLFFLQGGYAFATLQSSDLSKKTALFLSAFVPFIYVFALFLPRPMLVISSMAFETIGLSGGTHVYEWTPPSWEEERRILGRAEMTRVGPNRYTFCAYNVMRFDKQIALCATETCITNPDGNKIIAAYFDVQQFGPLVLNLDALRMIKATCARE
jgi:hypothetical protein